MASPSLVGAEGEWGQPNLWALGGLIVERGEKKKVQKKRKINERNEGVLDRKIFKKQNPEAKNGLRDSLVQWTHKHTHTGGTPSLNEVSLGIPFP